MVKTISKIGNSQGIIFDSVLLDMAHLKTGDQVNITVHEGGTITITPLLPRISRDDVSTIIGEVMDDFAATMKNLA
ncbi:MAG: AbrB family transcriptional regulator [Candidatus Kapabacteria bacterium]|nr:AbrB family transcriptional regulator [Candidatus Kapabacteria bacterium]